MLFQNYALYEILEMLKIAFGSPLNDPFSSTEILSMHFNILLKV